MTDLTNLMPPGEMVWVTYYNGSTLLFFLSGPVGMSSTMTAHSGAFTLYAVVNGGKKAKKLGSGGNPKELEEKFKVADAMKAVAKAS